MKFKKKNKLKLKTVIPTFNHISTDQLLIRKKI